MKNGKVILFVMFFYGLQIHTQTNLILNNNFELFDSCTGSSGGFDLCRFYNTGNYVGSPDYYNTCNSGPVDVPNNQFGYQYAQDGLSYVGLGFARQIYYRESILGMLNEPLKPAHSYCFEMYLNVNNITAFIVDTISVYFTSDTILPSNYMYNNNTLTPQLDIDITGFSDTLGWRSFSATYIANGGEKYFLLSNFGYDINFVIFNSTPSIPDTLAYYYVDNLSLVDCTPPTFIIPGGFSPNGDGLNDLFYIENLANYSQNSLTVINRWGDMVYEAKPYKNDWDGKSNTGLNIGSGTVTDGTYFYVFYPSPGTDPMKGSLEIRRNN